MDKQGIIIVGAKGAGKTTLLRGFCTGKEELFLHLHANALARQIDEDLGEQDIKTTSADYYKNQNGHEAYQNKFYKFLKQTNQPCFIFDSHIVYESEKEWHPVGNDLLSCFPFQSVIMVYSAPQQIIKNRLKDAEIKTRPQRNKIEIAAIQAMNLCYSQQLAETLGVTCHLVKSGDQQAFQKAIYSSFKIG